MTTRSLRIRRSGTLLLTDLGTAPERETICRWLRGGLQLPLEGEEPIDIDKAPPGWKMQTAKTAVSCCAENRRGCRGFEASGSSGEDS